MIAHILSAILLGGLAAVWRTNTLLNIAIRLSMIAVATISAIAAAPSIAGWLQ